jgi:hypothetical protein
MPYMARWAEVEEQAPELVVQARAYLEAHRHKTLATLRADGSPRISGTEAWVAEGELWWGSMTGALKARDLLRDGRFALHSGSDDPDVWTGDAKVAGVAEQVTDPARLAAMEMTEGHLFRADVRELSVVRLNDAKDALVVTVWAEGRGVRSVVRE